MEKGWLTSINLRYAEVALSGVICLCLANTSTAACNVRIWLLRRVSVAASSRFMAYL